MSKELKPPLLFLAPFQDWGKQALHIIDLRLALVIGLLAFLMTVSFDAARNPAEAADFANRPGSPLGLLPVTVVDDAIHPADSLSRWDAATAVSAQSTDSLLGPAHQLHHGMLTTASIVNDRLTTARFSTGQSSD